MVFIIHALNEWFDKNLSTLNVVNRKLIIDKDFWLTLVGNELSEDAYILCSCSIKVQLTKLRETFSLSNYYKHLRSKSCMMMRKKRISGCDINDPSVVTIDQQSFDDEALQNNSISNQTQSFTSSISTIGYINK